MCDGSLGPGSETEECDTPPPPAAPGPGIDQTVGDGCELDAAECDEDDFTEQIDTGCMDAEYVERTATGAVSSTDESVEEAQVGLAEIRTLRDTFPFLASRRGVRPFGQDVETGNDEEGRPYL